MLGDDKYKNEVCGRNNLEAQCNELNDAQHQLGMLRHTVDEKMREHMALNDELKRAKALLGEKCLDAHKTRENSHVKGHEVEELRKRLCFINKEIEALKADRAQQCRDISSLTDHQNRLHVDQQNQEERLKQLNHEIHCEANHCNELSRNIAHKDNDLHCVKKRLNDCQCELSRCRDCNSKLNHDVNCLKGCNDKGAHENVDLGKELDCMSQKNAETQCSINAADGKLKELCGALHCTSHDNECARRLNNSLCHENKDKHCERDALTSHVSVLTNQNGQLSNELTAFVH